MYMYMYTCIHVYTHMYIYIYIFISYTYHRGSIFIADAMKFLGEVMFSCDPLWWFTEAMTIALRAQSSFPAVVRVVDGTLHSAIVLEPLATHSGRQGTPKQVRLGARGLFGMCAGEYLL